MKSTYNEQPLARGEVNFYDTSQHLNIVWLLFCSFIFIIPLLSVLNLTHLGLKVGDIGMGAFIYYFLIIIFCFFKIHNLVRMLLHVPKILFLFFLIMLFNLCKLAYGGYIFVRLRTFQASLLCAIFFALGYLYVNTDKRRHFFAYVFLFCTLLLAIIGIIHFHLFPEINLQERIAYTNKYMGIVDYETMKYRESATMASPVGYSHMLTFGIIFVSLCIHKKIKWIYIFLLLYAIVISNSRSGFIYSICFLVWNQFFNQYKITPKKICTILLLLLLLFLFYKYTAATYPIFTFERIYSTGIKIRILKATVGLEILSANFMNIVFGAPPDLVSEINRISLSDNSYIQYYYQVGIIGFFILLMMMKLIYRKFKRLNCIRFEASMADYVKSIKYYSIAFMVFAIFSNIFNQLPQNIFLFLLLGSVFNIRQNTTRQGI